MTIWTHVGNCSLFAITPKPEKLEHFSSQGGIKLKDKVVFNALDATLELKLDEFVEDNLIIGLLGSAVSSGEITIGNGVTIERQVKLEGSNNFGPRFQIILPHVFFSCDKVIEFIGDKWGDIDLTGDILLADPSNPASGFGTITYKSAPSGAPVAAPNPVNYFLGKGSVFTAPL